MKRLLTAAVTAFLFAIMISCNHSQKAYSQKAYDIPLEAQAMEVDSTASAIVSKEPTPPGDIVDSVSFDKELGERKFIRTANLKFKVNRVDDAVIEIENRTRTLGGFVNYSRLNNFIRDSTCKAISQDSSIQIIHFMTEGFLILRVPDYRMDSLLTALGPLSTIMLNREITAEDVRIQMLGNQMTHRRIIRSNQRIANAISRKGRRLSDIEKAERAMEEQEEAADNAHISNLTLEDSSKFSTITVGIYQDPGTRYTEVVREKKIAEYEPPFFSQIGESFSNGWQLIKDLIILLVRFWTVIIFCLIGYVTLYKYVRFSKKVENFRV